MIKIYEEGGISDFVEVINLIKILDRYYINSVQIAGWYRGWLPTFVLLRWKGGPDGAFKKLMLGKLITFLKEVKMEIKKVNWPTRQQTIRYTLIILGISATVAIFLGSLDFLFTTLLDRFVL